MKILNNEQRTQEWFDSRLGKVTGSRAKRVYASNNLPLVDELIAEILTGEMEYVYTTEEMQRGTDLEPIACKKYEEATGLTVEHCGLCVHDTYDFLALSPDGWVDERRGAIEIKCPKSKTHVRYIRQGGIPTEYQYQVLHYFLVNEKLEWLDFVSYDPRVKKYPLFVERITREEITEDLAEAFKGVLKFYAKVEKYLAKI